MITNEQQLIIDKMHNPSNKTIVLAGPGSGKTTTLANGVKDIPYKFVAITFTNKAAKELSSKLKNQNKIFVGTFHGLGMTLLKEAGQKFIIIDQGEATDVIKTCFKEEHIDMGEDYSKALYYHATKEFFNNIICKESEYISDIAKIKRRYTYIKEKNKLKDFNDLLVHSLPYLSKIDCEAIIVDEWQDTNKIQLDMVKELTHNYQKGFTVVGDVNQCLYEFRGACYNNTKKLQKESNAEVLHLSKTWRFDNNIAKYCNELINKNVNCFNKEIIAKEIINQSVKFMPFNHSRDEDKYILETIRKYKIAKKSIVILGRTHRQLDEICLLLNKNMIKHTRIGGLTLTERAKTRRLMDLIYGLLPIDGSGINIDRLESFFKYIKIGLGKLFIRDYIAYKNTGKKSKKIDDNLSLVDIMDRISNGEISAIVETCEILDKADTNKVKVPLTNVIEYIGSFCDDAHDLLNRLKLMSSSDEEEGDVTVATIHAVKGLEFDIVMICHMEEGVYPSAISDESEIDAERRIVYVAMSRAKEKLLISWSYSRKSQGNNISHNKFRSRFISEMGYTPRKSGFLPLFC